MIEILVLYVKYRYFNNLSLNSGTFHCPETLPKDNGDTELKTGSVPRQIRDEWQHYRG